MFTDIDIINLAKKALTQPEDSWFDNEMLWETHGMSGFSVNRDSEMLDRSNFDVMVEMLTHKFGDENSNGDWWINHATHWAVGWLDQLMVRVLIDSELENPFIESNITEIFKFCMYYVDFNQNYVIIDEQHYYNLVYSELLKEIDTLMPEWASSSFSAQNIASFAFENDVQINESSYDWMIGESFVDVAAFILGMFDEDSLKYGDIDTDLQAVMDAKTFGYWNTTSISQTLLSEFFDWLAKDQLRLEI